MRIIYVISIVIAIMSCTETQVGPDTSDMALIEGGTFEFGNDKAPEAQSPAVTIDIPSFYLDKHEVSNGEYQTFVQATNYVTQAEEAGGSYTYEEGWKFQTGLYWGNEFYGEAEKPDEWDALPVVHVSFEDARSYCEWKNKRLPNEQELEYAMKISPASLFNIWQGDFPKNNTLKDGYFYSAPIKSYPADENGAYDLSGNVWEWTEDNYHYNVHEILKVDRQRSNGAWIKASYDPNHPVPDTDQKVIKGGSFLCHDSYCCGYKASARMPAEPKMTYFHLGFRCACDL